MALKDQYLTVSQAVAQFSVTRQTIHRWIRDGVLTAEKVGRELLINRQSLDEYNTHRIGVILAKMISWKIADNDFKELRDYFNFGKADVIKQVGKPEKLTFIVTKEDGTKDELKVLQYSMNTDEKRRKIVFSFDEIGSTPYKEPKRKTKTQGGQD